MTIVNGRPTVKLNGVRMTTRAARFMINRIEEKFNKTKGEQQ